MKSIPQQWLRRLPGVCHRYRPWLLDRGSLTRRIQERCAAFSVRKVRQRRARANVDETVLVGLRPTVRTGVREVYLYCGETPVVFAHSVLPEKSLRGAWGGLGRLGSKPLGAVLFDNPNVRRTPLQFRKVNPHHNLYRRACRELSSPPSTLWARRSVFSLHGRPILVTEVFLPGILELPQ
ncbi:MAG: chorismate lyase [Pseudomonadota bacterium]|jgi:chorismate--pyruvate lyase